MNHAECREVVRRKSTARVLQSLREWMATAGQTLHPERTKIVDMGQPGARFDFPGYRFWRGTQGRWKRFLRPKSVKRIRVAIRPLTNRANGHSLEMIAERLKPKLRGFYGWLS